MNRYHWPRHKPGYGGGLNAPIVLTWANSSAAQTFTITPTEAGAVTLGATNSGGMKDPAWIGRWFLSGQQPAPAAQPSRR